MKYLIKGQESKEKIYFLLELTKTEDNIQGGILDYFCRNFSVSASASLNNCLQPNLSKAINSIQIIAEIVEKINEISYIK